MIATETNLIDAYKMAYIKNTVNIIKSFTLCKLITNKRIQHNEYSNINDKCCP